MVERVTSLVFAMCGVVNGVGVAEAQDVRPLVVREPYIQMTTENSAVVVWRASRPLIPWLAVRTELGAVPFKYVFPGEIVIRVSEEIAAPPEIPKLGGAPEQTFQYEAYIDGLMPETF